MSKKSNKVTSLASAPEVKHEKKWTFSATSTQPTTSPLRRRDEPQVEPPQVIYTTEAWQTIQYIVSKCAKEVGWLGLVEKHGNDYWVTEVFIPEQEVTSVTTEIEAEAMAALAMWMMDNDRDPSQMYYWGHSHVNMGVSPSGQDETQLEEYLHNCNVFIRGIYNKKGDSKVDIFDTEAGVVHQCVDNYPEHALLSDELRKRLDKELKDNVTDAPAYSYNSGYNGGKQGGYQTPSVVGASKSSQPSQSTAAEKAASRSGSAAGKAIENALAPAGYGGGYGGDYSGYPSSGRHYDDDYTLLEYAYERG